MKRGQDQFAILAKMRNEAYRGTVVGSSTNVGSSRGKKPISWIGLAIAFTNIWLLVLVVWGRREFGSIPAAISYLQG
jgi:hypothetical protein